MYKDEASGRALTRLIEAAAETYAATGQPEAVAAADLLRACPPPRVSPPRSHPPAVEDLADALAALAPGPLTDVLHACAAELPWTDAAFAMPGKLAGRYAYVDIAGPEGLSLSHLCAFGLYLQMRETFYPAHSHAAEELYLVLSGTAVWQQDDGAFAAKAPGTLIHHRPWERHAMETAAEPLLAMWLWTGDLDESTYRIDGA